MRDDEDDVGSGWNTRAYTLCQSANFVCARDIPVGAFTPLEEGANFTKKICCGIEVNSSECGCFHSIYMSRCCVVRATCNIKFSCCEHEVQQGVDTRV